MLRALLADRSKLVVHHDTKPMPAYSLTAGKRPALKKSEGTGESGCRFQLQGAGQPQPQAADAQTPVPTRPTLIYTCTDMTMAAFAGGMPNMAAARQYLGSSPVVDSTGLTGAWDFSFTYSTRGGPSGTEVTTLIDAMDKLGLKLELAQVPTSVVVVDSVNEKPTANDPAVLEALKIAPPATEFEVADVKPSDPSVTGTRFQIQPGGRLFIQGATMKLLVQQAWNVNDDELLAGAPKWMDEERFDITAKAPSAWVGPTPASGAPAAEASNQTVDVDTLLLMLRALMVDRFKMAVHYEDRPVTAYILTASKPKLKKADPGGRTNWKEGPPAGAKDPRDANPALSRLVTCQNMTMAKFAELLPDIAPGYLRTPVQDATGLDGAWDFTLNFSPAGVLQGGGGRGGDAGQAAGAPAAAADPSGAVSLFDAMTKQLGLKLEMQKRPLPVLVIDHVERKPEEN